MYLGVYRFEGSLPALLGSYEKLLLSIPPSNLHLHVCVEREGAIEVYDACPTREAFEAFAGGAEFRKLLNDVGLPAPTVTCLGDTRAAYVGGQRVA